jgi:hypothetical protein
MVARFTSKKRAAAVVGDLAELEPQKGLLWFWASTARVVLSLSWRRVLAFIAAFYGGNWALRGFVAASGIYAQHRPPEHFWMALVTVLSLAGMFLCMLLFYTALRYGTQNRVTQLALTWTGLVTAVIFLWWQPVILLACVALSIWLMSLAILKTEYRKAALVILVSVATGFGGFLLTAYLDARYTRFIYSGPIGSKELQEHPSVVWLGFCMMFITTWLVTTACSHMHHWLLRDKLLDEEVEEGVA